MNYRVASIGEKAVIKLWNDDRLYVYINIYRYIQRERELATEQRSEINFATRGGELLQFYIP